MAEHLKLYHWINIDAGDSNDSDAPLPFNLSIATYMIASKQTSAMPLIGKKPFEKFQYLFIQ